MNYRTRRVLFFFPVLLMIVLTAAAKGAKLPGTDKDEVKNPTQTDEHSGTDLKSLLQYAADNGDKLNDSTVLGYRKLVDSFYSTGGYSPI